MILFSIRYERAESVGVKSRGRSFFYEEPKCLLRGTEVSFTRGRSVLSRGAEVSWPWHKRLFQKGRSGRGRSGWGQSVQNPSTLPTRISRGLKHNLCLSNQDTVVGNNKIARSYCTIIKIFNHSKAKVMINWTWDATGLNYGIRNFFRRRTSEKYKLEYT